MSGVAGTGDDVAARLCAACGMCCNGVMFHSMRMQPGDNARELAALGLKGKRRGFHIPQPCPAHKESCCAIYARRPVRCRLFVCKQLAAVASGAIGEEEALEKIREARRGVARVRELFQQAGDVREHKAFSTRYETLLTPPLDPSPHAVRLRGELVAAMGDLERLLAKDFRSDSAGVAPSRAC